MSIIMNPALYRTIATFPLENSFNGFSEYVRGIKTGSYDRFCQETFSRHSLGWPFY